MRSMPGLSQYTPPAWESTAQHLLCARLAGEDRREGLVGFTAGREACIAFVSVGYDQVTFP
jgi:hypothetical protein